MSSAERRTPAAADVAAAVAPPAPAVATELFGDRLSLAESYVARLAGDGVVRGLIGPREVPRLWERHLLNCAVLADELPAGARVVDVGSGAGLPGLVLAIRRPDLAVVLVEPMQRRVQFLAETIEALGVGPAVSVVRGRAEEAPVRRAVAGSSWVTARAVAPLDRLVEWSLPLLAPGGRLLALKGERARDEVASVRPALRRAGAGEIEVRPLGVGMLDQPTWVVVVERASEPRSTGRERRSR